jgi:hypothetical protein
MSEASLLADAVAKKASVEIVRIAMNFDFMILPMVVGGFFVSTLYLARTVPILEMWRNCVNFDVFIRKVLFAGLKTHEKTR